MAVYQDLAFLKILGHHHQCLVNRAVAVWMIFTHGISHNTGAFTVGSVITDSKLIHIIQGSSLYRLQAVPHIRKCPGNDNAHGIINIGFLHHVRIVRGNYIFLFCFHRLYSSLMQPAGILGLPGVRFFIYPVLRLWHAHK